MVKLKHLRMPQLYVALTAFVQLSCMDASLDKIGTVTPSLSTLEIKVPFAEANGVSAGMAVVHVKDAGGNGVVGFTPELSMNDQAHVVAQCLASNASGLSVCTFQSTIPKLLEFQITNITSTVLKGTIDFKPSVAQAPGYSAGRGSTGVFRLYRPRIDRPKDPDLNQNSNRVAVTTFGDTFQADSAPATIDFKEQGQSGGNKRARIGKQGVTHK